MTNEVLEKVREVTSFVRGLHEEYQMYQSALFRSLNWMASSNSPWRMLAASLVFQQAPPTADFKTETVFPNLTVAERALDLSTSEAALDSLATSGVIKLDDGLVLIHDLEKFLSLDEARSLDEAMSQEVAHET